LCYRHYAAHHLTASCAHRYGLRSAWLLTKTLPAEAVTHETKGPLTGSLFDSKETIIMTATKDPTVAIRCPSPVVLFGIDSRGKPKGARFGKQHASLAMKAATQLQLNVLASSDPRVAEIAARLPIGRVHATGRTFVPFIRRDLYDKLVAAAANGDAHPTSPPNGSSGASSSTPGGSAPHLPPNWQSIAIGDLVVANQSQEDGWYEAIVVEQSDDMFTLRWRDYPRERRLVRHRLRLGLLYPKAKTTAENGKSGKTSGHPKHAKPVAGDPASSPLLPKDWDEIDVNHLVLAKDDSQWGAFWEAITVEKTDDLFKLRWREKHAANVGLITRPRRDLALICPDAVTAN
jgi:hypothetical protein